MTSSLLESLQRVHRLSLEMIELASEGSQWAGSVESSILFGTLRDMGYKLRDTSSRELESQAFSKRDELPVRAEPSELDRAQSEDDPASRSSRKKPSKREDGMKKVLIVDDEPDVVTYLKTWFEDHGFSAATALDGKEALASLEKDRPQLITLDMSMPVQSGVKTYREIKESPELQTIPVIIITAIGEPMKTFLSKTRQVPAPEGFLAKPIELQELATLVKNIVN